jgi:hypothetical protein
LPAFEGVKSKDGSGTSLSICIDLLDVVRLTP